MENISENNFAPVLRRYRLNTYSCFILNRMSCKQTRQCRRLIWVCTVCLCSKNGTLGTKGLNWCWFCFNWCWFCYNWCWFCFNWCWFCYNWCWFCFNWCWFCYNWCWFCFNCFQGANSFAVSLLFWSTDR